MCSNTDFFIARNLIAQYPKYSDNFKKKASEGKVDVKKINSEFLMELFNERLIKHHGINVL